MFHQGKSRRHWQGDLPATRACYKTPAIKFESNKYDGARSEDYKKKTNFVGHILARLVTLPGLSTGDGHRISAKRKTRSTNRLCCRRLLLQQPFPRICASKKRPMRETRVCSYETEQWKLDLAIKSAKATDDHKGSCAYFVVLWQTASIHRDIPGAAQGWVVRQESQELSVLHHTPVDGHNSKQDSTW